MKCTILKKLSLYCFILSLISYSSKGQQPTWENGIACIIYTHCSPCHNPNGIAPFSLMSYEDAVDNVYGIKSTVNSGEMPPYPPDRSYRHYQNERYLSDDEKLAINQWIKTRVPSGDLDKAPTPPEYDYTKAIPDPDFTSIIPEYTVPADITGDLYRCFVLSDPLPAAQFISGIEIVPGNRSIVHHVNVFQDTSGIPVILDGNDSLPGYTMFGGIGTESAQLISSWVPGSADGYFYPENMGQKINPGSRIIIQIHYPLASAGEVDSTRVSFKYSTATRLRTVKTNHLLNARNNLQNGPFVIRPNKVKKFFEKLTLPDNENISLLAIAPHAHLICISMKAYAVKPDGDTVPLVKIKNWDFHWQGPYMFKQLITIPGGSTLYGEAVYDNTTNNPHNPSNPPKRVTLGEATTDEMMEFYFSYTKTIPGDDNVVFDTTTRLPTYNNCSFVFNSGSAINKELITESIDETPIGNNIVSIYPNPVHDKLQLTLKSGEPAKVLVYTINGQRVYETTAKPGNNQFDLQDLPKGFYLIKIVNQKLNSTLRFLKE